MKRIAIPVSNNQLCSHFGHCDVFSFVDVEDDGQISRRLDLTPPAHQPGVLPPWVAQQGAHVVLAGGIGERAITMFEQAGVHVLIGCPEKNPDELAKLYAAGTLTTGDNACNHDEEGHTCNH